MLSSSGLHSWATELKYVADCLSSQEPVDASLLDDSAFRLVVFNVQYNRNT